MEEKSGKMLYGCTTHIGQSNYWDGYFSVHYQVLQFYYPLHYFKG